MNNNISKKEERVIVLKGEPITTTESFIKGKYNFKYMVKYSQLVLKILPELKKELKEHPYILERSNEWLDITHFLDYVEKKYDEKENNKNN